MALEAVTCVNRYRKVEQQEVPPAAEATAGDGDAEDVASAESSEDECLQAAVSKEELDGYQDILEALSSDEEERREEQRIEEMDIDEEIQAAAAEAWAECELVGSDEEEVQALDEQVRADQASNASTDSDGDELDLEEYVISEDDDEDLEEPQDVSDDDLDFDDFDGEDDVEDELDLEDYEDEEDIQPLKLGFSTWLACWEQDLPQRLAKPRAARFLRERLLKALQETRGSVDANSFSLQWEHSLVFEDCPPLLGFVSAKDAEALLRRDDLADLKLSLAWSDEDEASRGRPVVVPPREIRIDRSRSRDRLPRPMPNSYERSSRPTWFEDIMSFPQERPKVAFDRDGVLVVYKPAFWTMTTCKDAVPISGRHSELQNWIRSHVGHRYKFLYHNDRAGLIHRLDVQTSGPIVCGSNPKAFNTLRMSLHSHRFYKEYIALMHGALPVRTCCGNMDYPLSTTRERGYSGWRTMVDPCGQEALTRYEAVAAYKYSEGHGKTQRYTLVRLQLITGKTHQIRVHLGELARRNNLKTHGIVGDYKYLPPRNLKLDKRICRRVFLHCYRLHFPMPGSEDLCKVRCPLPMELQEALQQIDLDEDLTQHYRRQCRKSCVMDRDDMIEQKKTNIPGVTDYDFWRETRMS